MIQSHPRNRTGDERPEYEDADEHDRNTASEQSDISGKTEGDHHRSCEAQSNAPRKPALRGGGPIDRDVTHSRDRRDLGGAKRREDGRHDGHQYSNDEGDDRGSCRTCA